MAKTNAPAVRIHLERAFREFGLPWRIRSDSGPPFATMAMGGISELAIWWIRLGITPERIAPSHPEQNGRHERMHRTLQAAISPAAPNLREQQPNLDRFRHEFNDVRPHEALGQRTPRSAYSCSSRVMPSTERSPEYPSSMKVRRADETGRIRFAGQAASTTISAWLAHEPIGLEEIESDTYRLWYGPLPLAEVTLGARPFSLVPLKVTTPIL